MAGTDRECRSVVGIDRLLDLHDLLGIEQRHHRIGVGGATGHPCAIAALPRRAELESPTLHASQ